jgi:molybdopterin synthase catalytic subunit
MNDITVRLRLFASLRQTAGWSQKEISIAQGATVADLLAAVEEGTPTLVLSGRPVYAAVNQQYVEREHILIHGDEIALFPPVSGGELMG